MDAVNRINQSNSLCDTQSASQQSTSNSEAPHVSWVTLSFRNTKVLHRSVTPNLKSNWWTLV